MVDKLLNLSPLAQGKEIKAMKIDALSSGEDSVLFVLDSESVLVSLYCESVGTSLSVIVKTIGDAGQESEIITFPTLTAPTVDLLLRKSAVSLQKIRIIATYVGAAKFEIRARGINAAIASTKIQSQETLKCSQTNITTSPSPIVPASLDERAGVLIMNNNVGGTEILYVGGNLSQATSGIGTPVYPGGNITVNISAGAVLYGVASSGTIDTRIMETGE